METNGLTWWAKKANFVGVTGCGDSFNDDRLWQFILSIRKSIELVV